MKCIEIYSMLCCDTNLQWHNVKSGETRVFLNDHMAQNCLSHCCPDVALLSSSNILKFSHNINIPNTSFCKLDQACEGFVTFFTFVYFTVVTVAVVQIVVGRKFVI